MTTFEVSVEVLEALSPYQNRVIASIAHSLDTAKGMLEELAGGKPVGLPDDDDEDHEERSDDRNT